MLMIIFQIFLFLFCLMIAPLGIVLGLLLYCLFGFWSGVIGFVVSLLIHIFGLEYLCALQKLAIAYLLIGLLHLMWPAVFIAMNISIVIKRGNLKKLSDFIMYRIM